MHERCREQLAALPHVGESIMRLRLVASLALSTMIAISASGCAANDDESSSTPNSAAAVSHGAKPEFTGEFTLKGYATDFLDQWFTDLKIADDGSFSGEMSANVADDDGNVEEGVSGPLKGMIKFSDITGDEGVLSVTYKNQQGLKGSALFKYKRSANQIDLMSQAAAAFGGFKSKWRTTSFDDMEKKIGNGATFTLLKK
jgi:hypothetical protein